MDGIIIKKKHYGQQSGFIFWCKFLTGSYQLWSTSSLGMVYFFRNDCWRTNNRFYNCCVKFFFFILPSRSYTKLILSHLVPAFKLSVTSLSRHKLQCLPLRRISLSTLWLCNPTHISISSGTYQFIVYSISATFPTTLRYTIYIATWSCPRFVESQKYNSFLFFWFLPLITYLPQKQ